MDLAEIRKRFIWIALVCFVSLWAGKYVAGARPEIALAAFAGIAILLVTMVNTNVAIAIIIFAMLLSPELRVAEVPGRGVVVRVEDILLMVVFFTWLAKLAINKELRLLRNTPLNAPIGIYIFITAIATFIGVMTGHVRPKPSSFYLLKYIEYLMLYFLVTNSLRDLRQVRVFIALFLVTAFIVCLYGYVQFGAASRITAPFEGAAEPNTLGGYLILVMAITMGLLAYSRLPHHQMLLGCLFILIIPVFLKTYSRCSYLALIPMLLTIVLLTRRKKGFLIAVLIMGLLLSPIILPQSVKDRIRTTFIPGKVYEVMGEEITLDYSASYRIESWKRVIRKFPSSPLWGYGVTGSGFIEGEVIRILGEVGILGVWAFVWLIMTIFRVSFHNLGEMKDDFSRGLIIGFVGGLVGLLVHSLTTNTFIIVRIMEPFWFITAIVVMLPSVMAGEEEAKAASSS